MAQVKKSQSSLNVVSQPVSIPQMLPAKKLARLLTAIEGYAQNKESSVFEFISAYDHEGCESLALEVALLAVSQKNKSVLILNTAPSKNAVYSSVDSPLPLIESLKTDSSLEDSIVQVTEDSLFYSAFSSETVGQDALIDLEQIETMIETMRGLFDIVFIVSEDILINPTAALFSRLCDGSILIVEADKTRKPVVTQIKKNIENNGGRLIGSILNKRRTYIPKWIYSLLYR